MATKRITEEECWFVIGAHQAGATERQCSELSGLSKTITHNIITNFKKLGSPHASKLSLNALLNTTNSSTTNNNNKRKSDQISKNEAMKPRKRGRPRNPTEAPFFTQAIVRKALLDGKTDQISYSPRPSIMYPLDRLNTPPSDDDTMMKRQRRDSSILTEELPPTPRSITLDELSDDEINVIEAKKTKAWTLEEDKQLLSHVLGLPMNNFKWKGLESQFGDRHMAKMCAERWDYIKKQILKDARTIIKEEEGEAS